MVLIYLVHVMQLIFYVFKINIETPDMAHHMHDLLWWIVSLLPKQMLLQLHTNYIMMQHIVWQN